jgi:hypothetical protein
MEATAASRVRLLAGHDVHYLDLVERVAKAAPPVEIKRDEIDAGKTIILIPDEDPTVHHGGIVFHKWEGKYIVLMGRETALRALESGTAIVKGKLVSRQALKRCKVDEASDEPKAVAPVTPPKSYDDDFRNAPRIVDKRPTPALLKSAESVQEVKPTEATTRPYQPKSDSYDKHQRNIRQMGNEAAARVALEPARKSEAVNQQSMSRAPRPAHNAAIDLKEDRPQNAKPGERLSEEELVKRAKRQHELDNAAGRVTFAPPDWREQFQAKFGRYPGSMGQTKPKTERHDRPLSDQGNQRFTHKRVTEQSGFGAQATPLEGGARINTHVEPGQDRPMVEFGQVERVKQEHTRDVSYGKRSTGLFGQNRRARQAQS